MFAPDVAFFDHERELIVLLRGIFFNLKRPQPKDEEFLPLVVALREEWLENVAAVKVLDGCNIVIVTCVYIHRWRSKRTATNGKPSRRL